VTQAPIGVQTLRRNTAWTVQPRESITQLSHACRWRSTTGHT